MAQHLVAILLGAPPVPCVPLRDGAQHLGREDRVRRGPARVQLGQQHSKRRRQLALCGGDGREQEVFAHATRRHHAL